MTLTQFLFLTWALSSILLIIFALPYAIMFIAKDLFNLDWSTKYWTIVLALIVFNLLKSKVTWSNK